MSEETKIIASESGHWYARDGKPCYEVENKSKPGTMRPTTLRDAKKLDLVPSVTSVLSILARPGLNAWKENQILQSAATSPISRKSMPANEWAAKILEDAQAQAIQAAEKGTAIHAAIEKYLISGESSVYDDYVIPVIERILPLKVIQRSKVEHSFAHPLGFGGKVDFHTPEVIIDFKTKEFTQEDIDKKKRLAWDENLWQLSGYRLGLALGKYTKCQNWFISSTVPGLIVVHEWEDEEVKKGIEIFLKTLDLWKAIKL